MWIWSPLRVWKISWLLIRKKLKSSNRTKFLSLWATNCHFEIQDKNNHRERFGNVERLSCANIDVVRSAVDPKSEKGSRCVQWKCKVQQKMIYRVDFGWIREIPDLCWWKKMRRLLPYQNPSLLRVNSFEVIRNLKKLKFWVLMFFHKGVFLTLILVPFAD